MRTELVHADECCMKIILLVITGNFLSGSFRFVGELESICFCIPSGLAVASHGTSRHLSNSLFSMATSHTSSGWQRQFPLCPDVDFLSITEVLRLPPSEGRCLGDEGEGKGPECVSTFSP